MVVDGVRFYRRRTTQSRVAIYPSNSPTLGEDCLLASLPPFFSGFESALWIFSGDWLRLFGDAK